MQSAPQNSLAEQVEMKLLFVFGFVATQNLTSGADKRLTRPGPDQQAARPLMRSLFQIGITQHSGIGILIAMLAALACIVMFFSTSQGQGEVMVCSVSWDQCYD